MSPAPLDVIFHRSMTRLATDGHLRHRRAITIRRLIIIFSQARVVAIRTHIVPVHSAPSPVSPFAGLPIFVAIHIKPLVATWIIRRFQRLKSSIGKLYKKLLQWTVANYSFNCEWLITFVRSE